MGLGAAFLGGVVSVGLALGWRWNMSCSALAGGGASVRGGLTMRGWAGVRSRQWRSCVKFVQSAFYADLPERVHLYSLCAKLLTSHEVHGVIFPCS